VDNVAFLKGNIDNVTANPRRYCHQPNRCRSSGELVPIHYFLLLRFADRQRTRFPDNDAVCAAEDAVVPSFGIRKAFTYLGQEFGQAFLVLKFESERMVGECELVVKLIYDFNKVALSPGC